MLNIIFVIQKGYQDLIHEIKNSSHQMQPSDALINVYTDIEKTKNNLSSFPPNKDQSEVDNDFSSKTRGTGEKESSVSPFLLLIFHTSTGFQLRRCLYTPNFSFFPFLATFL